MEKPKVNHETCIGCGTCEAIAPEVFKVEEMDGKMVANALSVDYGPFESKIKEAISACPTQAIT